VGGGRRRSLPSSILHLESDGAHATFAGDVIHHPIQLVRNDIALAFDFT